MAIAKCALIGVGDDSDGVSHSNLRVVVHIAGQIHLMICPTIELLFGSSGSESGYSSVDKQVGLRGRLSLISSLVIESSSNSTFSFGGGYLSLGSSSIIELSRRPSRQGTWYSRGFLLGFDWDDGLFV